MCIPYLLWIKEAFNPNMADHGMHEPLLKFFFKLNATELLQLNIKCHFFFMIWMVCCLCISNKQNTKHQVKLKFKQGLSLQIIFYLVEISFHIGVITLKLQWVQKFFFSIKENSIEKFFLFVVSQHWNKCKNQYTGCIRSNVFVQQRLFFT